MTVVLTTKDLAAEMLLHPRTVKRWWKRLGVPPDACKGNGCHRWTPDGAARLLKAWRDYWLCRDTDPAVVAEKAAGNFNPDKFQILFTFDAPKNNQAQTSKPNPGSSVRGRHDLA